MYVSKYSYYLILDRLYIYKIFTYILCMYNLPQYSGNNITNLSRFSRILLAFLMSSYVKEMIPKYEKQRKYSPSCSRESYDNNSITYV